MFDTADKTPIELSNLQAPPYFLILNTGQRLEQWAELSLSWPHVNQR